MFVKISGTPYFSYNTWNDWLPETWLVVSAVTWGDVNGPHSSKIMKESNPMVRDIVEDRSTADFSILDLTHSYSFTKGQYVEILSTELDTIFTGFIDTVSQRRVSPGGVIEHKLSCVDNHYLADKRLIAKAFVSPDTVADAVTWIIDNILDDEGISAGTITAPTVIEAISYDYVTVATALDDLAAYAGCTWFIDVDKQLYFVPRTTYAAAWDITEVGDELPDVLVESFEVYKTNPEYRNQQFIRGGSATTALQTEIKVGDGETSSWAVGYRIASVPTVSISTDSGKTYSSQTIGIKGVDTGKNWYWSANDQVIVQDAAGTRLLSTGRLKIEYYGLYQVIISSADFVEILAQQAIELSSGYVESVRDDTLVTTQDAGLAEANALLDHFAEIGTKVTYTTTRTGLEVGTLQHITSAIHGLDDDFLITQIEKIPNFYSDFDLPNALTMYNVQAVSGPVEDYWTKVFLRLNQGTGAGSSLANSTSVVLILRSYTGKASTNVWDYAVADGAYDADSALVPSFESGEEITYLSLWYGGSELFRKYRTSQTGDADSGKFVTTFILTSGEANIEWDTVKLYGGDGASSTALSGTVIYSVADSYIKNALESIQMVFTTTEA